MEGITTYDNWEYKYEKKYLDIMVNGGILGLYSSTH
jgi:hypothetical protein